jgi:hypothetical protein
MLPDLKHKQLSDGTVETAIDPGCITEHDIKNLELQLNKCFGIISKMIK